MDTAVEQSPRAAGRRTAATATRVVVAGLAATAVLLAGAHLADQHRRYGSWSWSAPSPTPLLPYREREYAQGPTGSAVTGDFVRIGTTWDGLAILGPAPGPDVPTEVVVRVGPGAYAYYFLKGGP